MEIQTLSSVTTALAGSQSASGSVTPIKSGQAAPQKAGGPTPAGKGDAKPAATSESSSSSSSTSTAKIYDKRDTNQDGAVSYAEELLYALKNQTEELQSQAAVSSSQKQTGLNAYRQDRQTNTQSQSFASV